MSGDLAAFLAARLDEDEAAAKDAAGDDDGTWGVRGNISPRAASTVVTACGEFKTGSPGEALHIACHDPARALREVAAKRAILAQWEASPPGSPVLTFALYNLAAVYSGHPGYRQEWKP